MSKLKPRPKVKLPRAPLPKQRSEAFEDKRRKPPKHKKRDFWTEFVKEFNRRARKEDGVWRLELTPWLIP